MRGWLGRRKRLRADGLFSGREEYVSKLGLWQSVCVFIFIFKIIQGIEIHTSILYWALVIHYRQINNYALVKHYFYGNQNRTNMNIPTSLATSV